MNVVTPKGGAKHETLLNKLALASKVGLLSINVSLKKHNKVSLNSQK
jgi:hypothetical protein